MESTIREISLREAKPVIEKWHYSHKVPTGKNIFFGWFVDGELYAVADYGIGVNAFQASFLTRVSGMDVTNTNLLELKRLARVEPRIDSLPLTKFLSECHALLRARGYKFIVSFSDPAQKHTGGIYKAASFAYLGQSFPEWHLIDQQGNIRHRRFAYRHMQRNGGTLAESRETLGLKRIKMPAKDRWFLIIDKKQARKQQLLREAGKLLLNA